MRTVRSIAELRSLLAPHRRTERTIGLVPTMGAFHRGHLQLMQAARSQCDVVVVSLFVNPSQFNDPRDLEAYPRDEAHDAALAQAQGVDVVFVPPVNEVYPPGFSTTVLVRGLTERLEGAHRGREHFDGVATVVTKLLNMVGPDVAYFGQKDAQQVLVIKQLVRDLNIPVRVAVCPTVREPDGLAMSSRNVHLRGADRGRAAALHRALQAAAEAAAAGELDAAAVAQRARDELNDAGVELEYLELVDPETLEPVSRIAGAVLALVAVRVGTTRLIDNQLLTAPVAVGLIPDGRT